MFVYCYLGVISRYCVEFVMKTLEIRAKKKKNHNLPNVKIYQEIIFTDDVLMNESTRY